jgi:predicted RND superfamily exporter protein
MEALAKALLKRNIAILVVVFCLSSCAILAFFASGVEQDDDVLAFLPQGNPDVALFYDINRRFGGLDVALVGLDMPSLFSAASLEQLQRATQALNDIPTVAYALSIANLEDPINDPYEGLTLRTLVSEIPQTAEAEAALKAHIMAQDHVVGTLVSAEGNAAMIYCFLAAGVDQRSTAAAIRRAVEEHIPTANKYWGGAPFISTWIFDTTQADMDRLTPWAIAAIMLLLLVTFRDLRGTLLALGSTGMGIAVAHGLMAVLGVQYNIVLSSMPIILFAVGSAYSIHILTHYYAHEVHWGRDEAIRLTLVGIGPTVLAAGLTTVAGLLSFVAMDITPMRNFGVFTAIGIFATLILSVTFVPAVLRLVGPRRKHADWAGTGLMVRLAGFSARKRNLVRAALVILCLAAGGLVTQVKARMDTAAFFNEGSPPDLADRFLVEHFGGSQFIQIQFKADLGQPAVLRELQFLADQLSRVPHISGTVHVASAVAQANEVMEQIRRIPDSAPKIGTLLSFMASNRAVSQLVSADRSEALLQLKLSTNKAEEAEEALAAVERIVADRDNQTWSVTHDEERNREQVRARIGALLTASGQPLSGAAIRGALDALSDRVSPAGIKADLGVHMVSAEFLTELPKEPEGGAMRLINAVVALGPDADERGLSSAIATALELDPADDLIFDLLFSLGTPLKEIWARRTSLARADSFTLATGLNLPSGPRGERIRGSIAGALWNLGRGAVLIPARGDSAAIEIGLAVSGLPVLHRGLSRSVNDNQWRSLGLALALVLVVMMGLFRSVSAGLLAAVPTFVTLLLIYGIMGARGVSLDIGTSMLASLIIGAGVDYAVHMLSAWKAPASSDSIDLVAAAEFAARTTGPAIWTNAAMVASGFFILTLGDARPLQNVGMLTASAMLLAAFATFIAIPALAQKRSYSKTSVLDAQGKIGN